VEVDFKEADEYVVAFDSVRPIYDVHRSWNLEDFRRQEHTSQTLKEQLDMYTAWEREVEKMRARQPCGILEVESRKLRCVVLDRHARGPAGVRRGRWQMEGDVAICKSFNQHETVR
jgi:hypothetical protein